MNRPIFILGAPKSGTSLVRALFDGHPDLFCVPVEAHFFRVLGWWVDDPFLGSPAQDASADAFARRVLDWIRTCNQADEFEADSRARGRFDLHRLETTLSERLARLQGADPAGCIQAYVAALHAAVCGRNLPENRRWLEKSVEAAGFAVDLARLFPEAVFFHVVRNPYANLVAIRRHRTQRKFPRLWRPLAALRASFYRLEQNRRRLAAYHVISYEDLVIQTEPTMRRMAEACGLAWNDALLAPTFLGEPWAGNSTTHASFEGVSRAPLDHWRKAITSLETALVNRFLDPQRQAWDYERETAARSPYWPVPGETASRYFFNRLLLWRADAFL